MTAQTLARMSSIRRRPVRLAYHWPPTLPEYEALWALAQIKAQARLYVGGELQNTMAAALGGLLDAARVGDRIVVSSEWIGEGEIPAEIWAVIGFEKEPLKRPVSAGIGGKRSAA